MPEYINLMIDQTETPKVDVSEPMMGYYNSIKEALDIKYDGIKKKLDDTKEEFLGAVKESLNETGKMNTEIKDLQEKVFSNSNKEGYKEEVKNLKNLVNSFIETCENLESVVSNIQDLKMNEFLSVNKDEFKLKLNKLKLLKDLKKKGMVQLVWSTIQKKGGFKLAEEGAVMEVDYSSCWNAFYGQERFNTGVVQIEVEINSITSNNYNCIGVANSNYNDASSCFCQKAANCFMLYADGSVSINGTSQGQAGSSVSFPTGTTRIIIIKLNLDEKKISFCTQEGPDAVQYNLNGTDFRLVVGMCNGGRVIYRLLDTCILEE